MSLERLFVKNEDSAPSEEKESTQEKKRHKNFRKEPWTDGVYDNDRVAKKVRNAEQAALSNRHRNFRAKSLKKFNSRYPSGKAKDRLSQQIDAAFRKVREDFHHYTQKERDNCPFRLRVEPVKGNVEIAYYNHAGDAVARALEFLPAIVRRRVEDVRIQARIGSSKRFHNSPSQHPHLCAKLQLPKKSWSQRQRRECVRSGFGLYKFVGRFNASTRGTILSLGKDGLEETFLS